jgi:hypothetical protein
MSILSAPKVTLDSAAMGAFVRSLEHKEAELDRIEYPDLPFAEGKIVPIQFIPDPIATTTTYHQVSSVGSFALLRNYTTALPEIDILTREFTMPIHKWGARYYYTDEDVQSYARNNISLATEKIAAVMEAGKQSMNEIIAFGDPTIGLPGFVTHPDCFRSEAAYAIDATTTSEEQLGVLNDAVNFIPEFTKSIEKPDTLLLPLSVYNYLSNLPYTVSGTGLMGRTVMEHFKSANVYIQNVMGLSELEASSMAAKGYPARPVIIAYKRDINKLKTKVFKNISFHDPKPGAGIDSWQRPATFKLAGVELRRPYSMHIVELPQSA